MPKYTTVQGTIVAQKRRVFLDVSNIKKKVRSDQVPSGRQLSLCDFLQRKFRQKEVLPPCPKPFVDIDSREHNPPLHCSEYAKNIFDYLLENEVRFRPRPNFLSFQKDITPSNRGVLFDWLVEVALEYSLSQQTIYLTKNYVDRFLSKRAVTKKQLQLVGLTAIFIASKFEEIYPPELDDFLFIADNAYTRAEVHATEVAMLQTLQYELNVATERCFLRRFQKAAAVGISYNKELLASVVLLSDYLTELTIVQKEFVAVRPSLIAASAVYLALQCFNLPWTPTLAHFTTYRVTSEDFRCCVNRLHTLHKSHASKTHTLKAVREKYLQSEYLRVSELAPVVNPFGLWGVV